MKIYVKSSIQSPEQYTLGQTISQPILRSADDIPCEKSGGVYGLGDGYYEELPSTKKFRCITFIDNNNQLQVMYYFVTTWHGQWGDPRPIYEKSLYFNGEIVSDSDLPFSEYFRCVRNNFSYIRFTEKYSDILTGAKFLHWGYPKSNEIDAAVGN